MATLSCYGAQIIIIVVLTQFAVLCLRNGADRMAIWCVATALATVVFWSCRYAVGCGA